MNEEAKGLVAPAVTFTATHDGGDPALPNEASHAELVVRIAGNEGRVRWPIPAAVKARLGGP